jgi:hypothetical protein
MPVQAAEHALRTELSLDGVEDVSVERSLRDGEEVVVTFRTATGQSHEVRVEVGASDPRALTCRSNSEEPIPEYRVRSVRSGRNEP